MTKPIDSFWFDLKLRHPHQDPADLGEALRITPRLTLQKGNVYGPVTQESNFWLGRVCEGITDDDFVESLDDFASLIRARGEFVQQFTGSGGQAELSMNQIIGQDDGVLFRLSLSFEFLKMCGDYGISLQVQAWSAED